MVQKTGFILLLALIFASCVGPKKEHYTVGNTEIMKWQDGKDGAISITFDDATINQFRQALPILDTLGFNGTFFINTADIPGSVFIPRFIGRPLVEIITETLKVPTDSSNLFERASAVRFLDIPNAVETHNHIGSLFEEGKLVESYRETDNAFAVVRKRKSHRPIRPVLLTGELITWKELKRFVVGGHEFGNHTISHPRLAVLDEPNLLYELEKCKEEILHQLGPLQTFSCECPFGTENERVMRYAYKIHPALRNRMPEPFLKELNRSSSTSPADTTREYVQWQRGPLQKTTVDEMKAWVDTLLVHKNIWLVLTFHGVDGIGWEAKPHRELKEYFTYMKKNEDSLWIATFRDVARYMRERMSSTIKSTEEKGKIILRVSTTLDTAMYNLPLTLKTVVDPDWKKVVVKQGNNIQQFAPRSDEKGSFILYRIMPTGVPIELTGNK